MLEQRHSRLRDDLLALFKRRNLRPVARPKDERRERLIAFRENFRNQIKEASASDLSKMNHALRQLLDLRYETLDTIPSGPDAAFVENQMNRWSAQQANRWDQPLANSPPQADNWKMLGLSSKEETQALLDSMILSLRPDFEKIARWLAKISEKGTDLAVRRLLAIRLQNGLCYTSEGARISLQEDFVDVDKIDRPGYTFFIAPWIEPGGTLDSMINREINPIKRPDQPGDSEIEELARKIGLGAAEN